ncbi:uncharacterized protein LOC128893576 isoform X1 [Hylaeus anthracinus]|uniref:uncharacterized protein LOC128893576 isoform X1 n=1 Tax=Hylaeus anthracinus TaxID=313031 RepID=UPI0023BA04E8|nr:uncharacterized protein LOC128893576 isoform X1 [Hylaeus anthracinus]
MTKNNRSEVNLKSTAYNQNGQNYFEQLAAYNSMSSHLRRVLMAKCVVDAKNKNFTRKRKRFCRQPDCRPRIVGREIKNDIIDVLAYDTLHHPADLLRRSDDSKCLCQREDQSYLANHYGYGMVCSRSRLHNRVIYPSSTTLKTNKTEPFISNDRQVKATKAALKFQDLSEHSYEEDSMVYQTATDFLTQEINHLSMTVSSSRSYDKIETPKEYTDPTCNQETCMKDEEEAKYAKFVYDITCEIIQNGLYTDEQLQDVFQKHLKKNETLLSMNKMMYEIYQLKDALNMSDDQDAEELKDLVHSRKFNNLTFQSPTPPKVLNENKIMEKLKNYEAPESQRKSNSNNKSVVLIDPNPELIITERDILSSLIESNINPEQAQQIYKRLSTISKDEIPVDLMRTRPGGSNDDNVVSERDRIDLSVETLSDSQQEKGSTTSDLMILEDKEVQA